MEILKFNRPLAIAVMIAVIIAAIPCGALRSVSALERKTERIYEEGDKRDGTVRTDLTKLAEYAQNLYAAAEPLGCADAAFAEAIRAMQTSLDTPMTEDTLTPLMNAASLSYNRIMANTALTEAQKNSAVLYFYEMDAIRARLRNNDAYADAARKYNRAIDSFPASLFCGGKDKAMTFGN